MRPINWLAMVVLVLGGCGGMSGDAATHAESLERASQMHYQQSRAMTDMPSLRAMEADYRMGAMAQMDRMDGDHKKMCSGGMCADHMKSMDECAAGMRAELERHAGAVAAAQSLDAAMQEEDAHRNAMGKMMGCMKCPMMENGMMGGGMMGGMGGMGM